MIRFSAIVIAMLIISACSSTRQHAPEPAGDSETTNESVSDSDLRAQALSSDEGGLVCRYEKTISSRIGKRICRTKAAEQAAREAGRKALERNAIRMDKDRKVTE